MENKYYTPAIKEFCVGFEYEYSCKERYGGILENINGDWKKEIFIASCSMDGYSEIEDIRNSIPMSEIRVKLLDREDLESLGWIYDVKFKSFDLGEHQLSIDKNMVVIEVLGDYDHEKTHFRGTIKNKSELRKLLEQLGIK